MWLQTAELPAGLGRWIRPILRLPLWPLSHCLSPPSRQEKTRPRLLRDPVFTACRSRLARPTETSHTLTVLLWKKLGAHWTLALWPSCKGVCKCKGNPYAKLLTNLKDLFKHRANTKTIMRVISQKSFWFFDIVLILTRLILVIRTESHQKSLPTHKHANLPNCTYCKNAMHAGLEHKWAFFALCSAPIVDRVQRGQWARALIQILSFASQTPTECSTSRINVTWNLFPVRSICSKTFLSDVIWVKNIYVRL